MPRIIVLKIGIDIGKLIMELKSDESVEIGQIGSVTWIFF